MDVDNTASMEADAKDEHNSVVYEPKITAGSSSQEIGQLKDMLLLHLDLMQQQQETILMKDRQLQSLHQEKSAVVIECIAVYAVKLLGSSNVLTGIQDGGLRSPSFLFVSSI
ncbi:hypothetical protein CAPTEDRAFT_187671 [Capitella teleta]|uniref:Uncharacterized protein n=1 Tax=Capitella teleta TaxID=283909 RepID=R7VDU7_CAPTE|nr:hypothetical protein CAPTEDRAFT_187671 [Capitella teleta]|eukprot:ELU13855.1 hypothetical protein CAPTEDRAFT_187671 [Capitella teleta]